jgi:hypothetical protein
MMTKAAVCSAAMALFAGFGAAACAAQSASDPVRARLMEFFGERTSLLYNCLPRDCERASSFTNGWREWSAPFGYGRGMEDSAIMNGIALVWAVDSGDDDFARQMARGLINLATAHGKRGFVARGLCLEDGKSACTLSSRDQITHFVHGLYHWSASGRCDDAMKREIASAIGDLADRMLANVTAENDYNALTADGKIDPKGILKMWEVRPHEAARLPMIYLAAARLTGEKRFADAYERYVDRAMEESARLPKIPAETLKYTMPGYAFLQMNASIELICRADPARAARAGAIMRETARMAADRFIAGRGEDGPWLSAAGDLALAIALASDDGGLERLLGEARARQVRKLFGDCLAGRDGQKPLAGAWPSRIVALKAAERRFAASPAADGE